MLLATLALAWGCGSDTVESPTSSSTSGGSGAGGPGSSGSGASGGATNASSGAGASGGSTASAGGAGACGLIGTTCDMACGGGLTCYVSSQANFCAPAGPECGGFANAMCPASAPNCLYLKGADYGPCFTDDVKACICANAPGAVDGC